MSHRIGWLTDAAQSWSAKRASKAASSKAILLLALTLSLCEPIIVRAAGIEAIAAYSGTWTSRIVHYKTVYSKPRTETTKIRNVCWKSAGYYACNQFVNGPSEALIVFTYDRPHDLFHVYTVPADGGSPESTTMEISGNTWTYPWQGKDHSKTVYFRVRNTFTDPRDIEYRQEYSLDRIHWITTASGSEHRQ